MGAAFAPVIAILAAGESRRFGQPKQLADMGGEPLLRRVVGHAIAAQRPTIVVLGAHAERVRTALTGLLVDIVINSDWAAGLGTSIACAAAHVQATHPDCSGLLLCLADQPFVDSAAMQRLLDAHRSAPEQIQVADYGDACGPPCLFPRNWLPQLARLQGSQGARNLLRQHPDAMHKVPMPEAQMDIDTPDDLRHALLMLAPP